ncbi:MAG: TonB-dependent receptor, partial [Ginsengibacter sp.]
KMKIFSLFLVICMGSFLSLSVSAQKTSARYSISGKVTDASGSQLAGASAFIPDLGKGNIADANGHFVISDIPAGNYLVEIKYIGYKSVLQNIYFNKNIVQDFSLSIAATEQAPIVVTGESKAVSIRRDPVPMAVIDKNYINDHPAAGNVIAEIANIPGVSAVTTGPNISKPFIRGLGYNRVVTAEDGIRQEGQQWGDEHGIEVDQNSIDRIEVIKGPASLSFGPDAIGGVVNLLTAPPVEEGKILGAVTGNYGTNNGLINTSLKLQGNQNGFVWGTVISDKEAKNYQNQHDGRVYATGFKEKDARAMIGLNKSWGHSYLNASVFDDLQDIPDGSRDSLTRKFTYQVSDDDVTRPIVPESMLNSYNIPVLHQHVQLSRIYNNTSIHLGNGNLLVNLGYQYSHRREYTHPTEPDIPGLNLQLTTYTYDVKYNFPLGNDYQTTFGVNGMYQNNSLGYGTDFPIPAYKQFDFGPFFVVKKVFGKLDLSGGARFDTRSFNGHAAYLDTTVQYYPQLYKGPNPTSVKNIVEQFDALKKNFSGPSGSLGGTYNFSDKFLLKANLASGFRAPSISELSANGADPGSQIFHVGNSDFKPEFSVQGDFGAFLTLKNVSASLELFDNQINHYIFQQQILDANGNPERVNSDGSSNPNGIYSKFTYVQSKARIDGGEFSIDIHPIPMIHFQNSLSVIYGTNLGTGSSVPDSLKYLPFIPPLHTHSELRVSFPKALNKFKNIYAFAGFDHFNSQNRFFAAYGTETYTDGYNLLSAGIGANLVNASGRTVVELNIEGTNLANVNYQSNMSRLKYFDNLNVQPGIQPGIFNIGRDISFKAVVPFDLSSKKKTDSTL